MLGGLGLHLAGRLDVRNKRDVQEEDILPADLVTHLAGGLEERKRLDVADGATDLVDDNIGMALLHRQHTFLDLVGDMGDHLDSVSQVVAPTLLGDDRGVHLASGHIGLP